MAELLRQAPINYELLRNNRFQMVFPDDIGLESVWLKTCDKPKININPVELPYMNMIYYVAGQVNWESMNVEMICTIGPSSSQKVMEWIRLCIESLTGRMGYASSYMKNIEINSLDPAGVVVDKWVLRNAFITNADFGSLDMSSDEVQTLSFTIQPQDCILKY